MSLAPGTRLGPYEVIAPLGSGGMGAVYRARDTRLDRVVAIKVLLPQAAGDESATARLTREARAVAAISHPNVLGIFDVGEHEGRPFVVTELLEGATLREEMRAGALPLATAVGFALQIAHGLAAAHDQGVVHRDLKPENLFITRDRRVKILDFGLARMAAPESAATDETRLNDVTNPGTVMGTAGYMSPEQARGLAVDHRSDIFAFGTIVFEMLSGQRAFRGATVADTMASIVRDEPPDLQRISHVVPAPLARVVARCLAKDVHARVQSIRELPPVLEVISGARVSATTAEPAPPDETGVVVLPFENMSPDPENAYFADGLTEEIISDLARIGDLRVISRTTAMQLKGRKGDLSTLARELRVDYVVDGSVRKAGDKVRINVQLIRAASDTPVWSEKYAGTMDDVFDIQERVARAVAEALRVKLTPEESREIALRPIDDPVVYECYLRARAGLRAYDEPSLRRAMRDIDEGMALGGENPLLLAVKGEAAWQLYNIGLAPAATQIPMIQAIADRIEAIEPGSPRVHRLLALVAGHSGRVTECARRMGAVVAADPNDAFAWVIKAFACGMLGRMPEARDALARAERVDPLEPLVVVGRINIPLMCGDFDEAVRAGARAHARAPDHPVLMAYYIQALASAGHVREACDVAEAILRVKPDEAWSGFAQLIPWGLRGDGAAIAAAMTPEWTQWARGDAQNGHMVAQAFALAGRPDDAFVWLARMMDAGGAPYPFISSLDPLLSSLHTDPRWPAFLERLKGEWERVEL